MPRAGRGNTRIAARCPKQHSPGRARVRQPPSRMALAQQVEGGVVEAHPAVASLAVNSADSKTAKALARKVLASVRLASAVEALCSSTSIKAR